MADSTPPTYQKPPPRAARPASTSWAALTVELLVALLYSLRGIVPAAVASRLIGVFGVIILTTPLTLWVAWSLTVFFWVLGLWVFSLVAIVALLWMSPGDKI